MAFKLVPDAIYPVSKLLYVSPFHEFPFHPVSRNLVFTVGWIQDPVFYVGDGPFFPVGHLKNPNKIVEVAKINVIMSYEKNVAFGKVFVYLFIGKHLCTGKKNPVIMENLELKNHKTPVVFDEPVNVGAAGRPHSFRDKIAKNFS